MCSADQRQRFGDRQKQACRDLAPKDRNFKC